MALTQRFQQLNILSPPETGSTVYLVEHRGARYALKVYPTVERYRREAAVYRALGAHPNVLPTRDVGSLEVVSPVADGDLFDCIVTRHRDSIGFSEAEARRIVRQVVEGLVHARRKGWAHGDVKPDNVLVFGDKVRIADWENAQPYETPNKGMAGTVSHMAPECFFPNTGKPVGAADVWALGVTLFNIVCNAQPFALQGKKRTFFGGAEDYARLCQHFRRATEAFRAYGKVPSRENHRAAMEAASSPRSTRERSPRNGPGHAGPLASL